jgi:hyperosmotically inducible periplasmic protein
MRKRLRVPIIAALLAMLFAAASNTPASPLQKSAEQNEPTSERQLIREVHHVLVMLPYYSVFDNLAYRVEGDKVILEGQVVLPTLKSDAGAAVKSIEGVRTVVNNIEVLPVSAMDNQLRFCGVPRGLSRSSQCFRAMGIRPCRRFTSS